MRDNLNIKYTKVNGKENIFVIVFLFNILTLTDVSGIY